MRGFETEAEGKKIAHREVAARNRERGRPQPHSSYDDRHCERRRDMAGHYLKAIYGDRHKPGVLAKAPSLDPSRP